MTAVTPETYAETLAAFIAAKDRARAEHKLAYLFWECTLRCNLTCRHCGSDCVKDNTSAAQELAPDVVCRELSAIAARYDPEGITFAIIGGGACHSFRLRCPARDANAIVVAPSMQ